MATTFDAVSFDAVSFDAVSFDAVSDLVTAASRARDLCEGLASAAGRARALAIQTNWQANAARVFREAVEAWCAELAGIGLQLGDLADETTAAAAAVRARREAGAFGAFGHG